MDGYAVRRRYRALGEFGAVFVKHPWGKAGIHYPDKLRHRPVETGLASQSPSIGARPILPLCSKLTTMTSTMARLHSILNVAG